MHGLRAQERPAAPRASKRSRFKPNFWVIFGGGANVAVQSGDEGLIVVDTGSAPMADRCSPR